MFTFTATHQRAPKTISFTREAQMPNCANPAEGGEKGM